MCDAWGVVPGQVLDPALVSDAGDRLVQLRDTAVLPCDAALAGYHTALTGKVALAFSKAVHLAAQHIDVIRLGSLFSGSDVIVSAVYLVLQHIEKSYGVTIQLNHKFSVEKKPDKRAWIAANTPPKYLFENVSDLHSPHAHDTLSDTMVRVPSVDLATAGWPCKSRSRNNVNRVKLRDCIKNGTDTSGVGFEDRVPHTAPSHMHVLWGRLGCILGPALGFCGRRVVVQDTMGYVERAQPPLLILENVPPVAEAPSCQLVTHPPTPSPRRPPAPPT